MVEQSLKSMELSAAMHHLQSHHHRSFRLAPLTAQSERQPGTGANGKHGHVTGKVAAKIQITQAYRSVVIRLLRSPQLESVYVNKSTV